MAQSFAQKLDLKPGQPTDLNRDILWNLVEPAGWRPVRMVALDETWSAMRFRREEGSGS